MAMVELHHLGHIVETYAKAFYVVDVAGGDTVEFFEDMFLVLLGDADAMVADTQLELSVNDGGGYGDVGCVGGVFYTIVNEVVDKIGEMQLVGHDD